MSNQKGNPAIHSSISSLIKCFFETLTDDQLPLLIAGTLDESVKDLMIDLISQIIQNLSTVLMAYIRTMGSEVTQELVQSSLGNAVTESFKAALSVTDRGQTRSAQVLRDMISEEVLVTVQCSMSDTPKKHVTSPKRLEKMLKLASRMIKSIKNRAFKKSKKEKDSKPREPRTPTPTFNENPLDSLGAIPMDFCAVDPFHSSEEFPLDVCEEIPLDVCEEIPLDVCEEIPLDVCEEIHLDDCEEIPLDVSEEIPLDVSEEIPLDVSEEIPLDVSEENPLDVSDENPLNDSLEVNFLPTPGREELDTPTPSDHLMDDLRKHIILLIVERLVSLTYSKCAVGYYLKGPEILIERLGEKTLNAVEDFYFDPSSETFVDLEKAILKDMMKKWGSAVMVLTHMKMGSLTVEKFIADAIKTHLTAPKKRSCTRWFVSIVARACPCLRKVIQRKYYAPTTPTTLDVERSM